MKLYYITRVCIPSEAAQSVQIDAMAHAFHFICRDFKLISIFDIANHGADRPFTWDKICLFTPFRYLEFVIKSLLKVLSGKPTHVFTRDIGVAFVLSLLNLKVCYEAHKEPKTKMARLLISVLKYKRNFFMVVISNKLKEYYTDVYGMAEYKILACHDGVFVDEYDSIRSIEKKDLRLELQLPLEKKIIMHTGSLYKGEDAKLFKYVLDNFDELLFVQVGGSAFDIERYRKYYKNKNIRFIVHQTAVEVRKYQMCSDLLFYPLTKTNSLWWCTSPLKIFEYMATGIPIIASNIGSVGEVLTGNNCVVFDPTDPKTLIDAVSLSINQTSYVSSLAERALSDVRANYTWYIRANKVVKFIAV